MSGKDQIRKELQALRAALDEADRATHSEAIIRSASQLREVTEARTVFCYAAAGQEVDTLPLLEALLAADKAVLVPKVIGKGRMEAHRIDRMDALAPGTFDILEPQDTIPFEGTPDVCFLPGVAFTPRGDRLGRGGGFYDRYLAQHPAMFTVGLAFDAQIQRQLPTDPHDRRVDRVITERRVIICEESPMEGSTIIRLG